MWQDLPDLHHAVAVDARLDVPGLAGDRSNNVGGFTDTTGVDGTDPELIGFTLDLCEIEKNRHEMKKIKYPEFLAMFFHDFVLIPESEITLFAFEFKS